MLLLVSLALHLILIGWGGSKLAAPSRTNQAEKIVIAEIKPLPAVDKPVLLPEPPKPAPQARPKKAAAKSRPQPAPEPLVPDTPIRETVTPIAPPAPVNPIAAAPVADATAAASADNAPTGDSEPTATTPGIRYRIKPPPSAELSYAVEALQKGLTYHGSGKITWQTDGGSYVINGEAGALFITALDFKSEGEIDSFGVAPVIYTEKRFRKAATNTHFHRERNIISFSASTNSYPRTGGEQDRASIVWQLASIGRGDSEKFTAGAVIDVFVAGTRDAETWRIQVIGQEQITVGTGTIETWHVIRVPQPGSYEQRLDIWLAPDEQWYPIKLRFTETNGDFLDMSLSKLKPLGISQPT
ncbi:DUF3108 domain-containing protein [Paraherbaspirillum soli]|uniref:DUF3108 domain-containing protein n=1 Tax=Paraherbaspirillum soli TaxID=631222 RepID=A0ABW0M2N0_9BURK